MRVTWVLASNELNGGHKVVALHAALLAAHGHEARVVAAGPRPEWFPAELPWHDLGTAPGAAVVPPQDLVVATFWTTIELAERLALGPVAHYCQGYEGDLQHNAPVLSAIEAAYARPHPLLAVTPHLAGRIAPRFGRAAAVLPPVLDPRFAPRERQGPATPATVVVPGIFEAPVKDVATALRAAARLRAGGLALRVVRLSILPLGDAERALLPADRFLVGVAPQEVATVFADADLLLFPSRRGEGFGLPLLEAMGAGVPAVATRIPSTEWMTDGVVPLVDEGDDAAMARAAEPLLRDPGAWLEARRRGLVAAARFAPAARAAAIVAALAWAASPERHLR